MTIPVADIRRAVARHYGLTRDDLIGVSRARRIVRPRMMAMILTRQAVGVAQ